MEYMDGYMDGIKEAFDLVKKKRDELKEQVEGTGKVKVKKSKKKR